MKKTFLFLVTAISFVSANAQSKIEPGTEEALRLVQDRKDLTCQQPPADDSSRGKCVILNHTPYSYGTGIACVKCGGTYVSVTWTPNYNPKGDLVVYESSIVSNCNW